MQAAHQFIVEPIGLNPDSLSKPIDWAVLFGNDHPIELEIGMGKGTFLTDQAESRPEVNFFGIEWANWFWRHASDRLRRHNCLNARTVRAEAGYFLTEHVPVESLSALHIYFPDPWPKARHHKRRLIQPNFMTLAHRVLQRNGLINVVTDHEGYWNDSIEMSVRNAAGFSIEEYTRPNSAAEGEFVGTNFERKYRREGRPFYAIAARKR